MKVLHTCFSKSWGGLEMYTLHTIEQLKKRNIAAELLCYPGSKIHIEALRLNINVITRRVSWNLHPVQISRLAFLLRKNKYDLIHTQLSKDLWCIVPALNISRLTTPLLLSKQVGSFIIKKDFLHKIIYDRIDYALAISEIIKRNLLDTTTLGKEKIILLHNGIDTNKFNPANYSPDKIRSEFNIEKDQLLIGMIARFTPGKGHEQFLAAAKELTKKYDNLKFMIVGEPSRGEDKYADKIKKLSEQYALNDKVIFTGYREDTPNIISAFDIFAFPSHSEAFGLSLVEAMSMGKPTVCSNSDGVLDIAVDGVTSFLFQNKEAVDLQNKLQRFIESKELRTTFGNAGRQRVMEKFDSSVFTNSLLNIYDQALQDKNK